MANVNKRKSPSNKIHYKTGDKIGYCTYLRELPSKHWQRRAVFLCECGKEFENYITPIRAEKVKGCGCKRGLFKHYIEGEIIGIFGCKYLRDINKRGEERRVEFLCHCGNIFVSAVYPIKNGDTQGCGCRLHKHGHATVADTTPTYKAWTHMKKRCSEEQSNPKIKEWYFDRGITVCERWQDSFIAFLEDMRERPLDKTSFGRIDNDKGYYKENCRWEDWFEQANNTTKNVFYIYNGERKTLSQWSKIVDIPMSTLRNRIINLGWTISEALETPKIKPGFYLKKK